MSDAFLIARNPVEGSRLPYLLRLPVAGGEVILATRDTWPATRDLYCHALEAWPEDAEVLEEIPVVNCWRRGAAVHLVLSRRQRRRSLFVWTQSKGRELIFWRSERSMRTSRPGIRVPQARGLERALTVAVDTRERYPWRFSGYPVTVERRRLPVGDYAVFADDRLIAAVERKGPKELASDALSGKLSLTMAELATLPRGVVVVEGRLSELLKTDVEVQPGWLLNLLAGLQATHANVPVLFAETPKLAGDLAYRWLAASRDAVAQGRHGGTTGMAPDGSDQDFARDGGEAADRTRRARRGKAGAAQAAPELPLFPGMAPPDPDAGVAQGRADAPLAPAERKLRAVERARKGQVWTLGEYAEVFHVSKATAGNDLRALAEAGSLRALGNRRSLRYVATANMLESERIPD